MQDTLNRISAMAPSLRIAIIGDVMLDENLSGSVNRISPEAPVMVMLNEKRKILLGGAANVAAGVLALGATCRVMGVVGDDPAADEIRMLLRSPGAGSCIIDIPVDPTRPTTVKTRFWGTGHGSPHQLFRVDTEKTTPLSGPPKDELLARVRRLKPSDHPDGVNLIVISDYGKGVVTRDLVDAASSTGIPIIAAPKPVNGLLFKGVDMIVPNLSEAVAICKSMGHSYSEPDAIAQALQQGLSSTGTRSEIVITLGKDGILTRDRNGTVCQQPTVAKEVFDVTGAGDTVLAVLSVGIAAGLSVHDAAAIANSAAGIKVRKLGVATVTWDELKEQLQPDHS